MKNHLLAFAALFSFHADLYGDEILARFDGGTISKSELNVWLKTVRAGAPKYSEAGSLRLLAIDKYLAANFDPALSSDEQKLQRRMLEAKLYEAEFLKHLREQIQIPEETLDAAVKTQARDFSIPRRHRLRNIFIAFDQNSPENEAEAKLEMEALRSRIIDGADFADLARRESESSNRFDGGLLGNVRPGQLPEPIEKIAFQLKPGEVSQIISTGMGYTILYCENVIPAIEPGSEEVREKVRANLFRDKFEKKRSIVHEQWMKEVEWFPSGKYGQKHNAVVAVLSPENHITQVELNILLKRNKVEFDSLEDVSAIQYSQAIQPLAVALRATEKAKEPDFLKEEAQNSIDWKLLKRDAEEELSRRFQKRAEFTKPTSQEIRDLYQEVAPELMSLPRYKLSFATITITKESLPSASRFLNQMRKNALANSELEFSDIATKTSGWEQEKEKVSITDSEWFRERQIRSFGGITMRVIRNLSASECSPVFQTANGSRILWLIRLHDTEAPHQLTFEQARNGIESELKRRKIKEQRKKLEEELLEEMKFELVPNN